MAFPIIKKCNFCDNLYSPNTNQSQKKQNKQLFCSNLCSSRSRNISAEERFWKNIDKQESCWIWTGLKDAQGYGRLAYDGNTRLAHRFSFKLANPEMEQELEKLCVRHSCDNPACVNPNHLSLGEHKDNVYDKVCRGRQAKGERINSKLTGDAVKELRKLRNDNGLTYQQLGDRFGIARETARKVVLRKYWNHID